MQRVTSNRREFARVEVALRARFRIVRGEEIGRLQARILESPSVWAPEGESVLLQMAAGTGSSHEGALARALLDVSRQLARLSQQAGSGGGPSAVGEFEQLSGNGGLLATRVALLEGARLDLRIADEEFEAPPVRILAEVLGPQQGEPRFPLRFEAIHPTDRERLVRFIHALQRRRLRASRESQAR